MSFKETKEEVPRSIWSYLESKEVFLSGQSTGTTKGSLSSVSHITAGTGSYQYHSRTNQSSPTFHQSKQQPWIQNCLHSRFQTQKIPQSSTNVLCTMGRL